MRKLRLVFWLEDEETGQVIDEKKQTSLVLDDPMIAGLLVDVDAKMAQLTDDAANKEASEAMSQIRRFSDVVEAGFLIATRSLRYQVQTWLRSPAT